LQAWQDAPKFGFDFEVRLDAADGKVIGTGSLLPPPPKTQFGMVNIKTESITDGKFHTIYISCKAKSPEEKATAGITGMQFGTK
jgi:hypothetical protein